MAWRALPFYMPLYYAIYMDVLWRDGKQIPKSYLETWLASIIKFSSFE
jgi:hypothetical protein